MDLIEKKSLFFGKMIGVGIPNPFVLMRILSQFVEPLNRPHLSLEDLYSLRNVNEYFNSQIDQYLKYRFMATYELEDPFLFLLTWIDTTNEETVQNWHFLTHFESFGVNSNSLSVDFTEPNLKESYDEESINSFKAEYVALNYFRKLV